jgi:hypothetical protein
LAGPKNFGAKVENPKNFPVEILKTGKSSGKIRNVPKIFALIWQVPEKIPAHHLSLFAGFFGNNNSRDKKPHHNGRVRHNTGPVPFIRSADALSRI